MTNEEFLIAMEELKEKIQREKYADVDIHSTEMSEEYETEHKWELSANFHIEKCMKIIDEITEKYSVKEITKPKKKSPIRNRFRTL